MTPSIAPLPAVTLARTVTLTASACLPIWGSRVFGAVVPTPQLRTLSFDMSALPAIETSTLFQVTGLP